MATHSNILAWEIPWTEEPGRLQAIGSHRVGHDWSDLARTHSIPWCSYIPVCLTYSSVEGHLGCFQFSSITNKAAINVQVRQVLCVNISFQFSEINPQECSWWALWSLHIFCLFKKLPKCFPEPAVTFYIPTSNVHVAILCIPLAYDVTVFYLPITGI